MEQSNNKNVSIINIMITSFIILMLVFSVIIGCTIFSNWLSSSKNLTERIAKEVNDDIYNQINYFLYASEHVNAVNNNIIQNSIVDITNDKERDRFFVGGLNSQEYQIYSFSYGTSMGEFFGAHRNESGKIEIIKNDASTNGNNWYYSVNDDFSAGDTVVKAEAFDPRIREWYKAAVEAGETVFSPIYKRISKDELTISSACPIYDSNGDVQGVMATHILLSSIDFYLREVVQQYNGYAFIVEKNTGKLVANSMGLDNFRMLKSGAIKQNTINDVNILL